MSDLTLDLLKIPVTNFPRARDFYRDALGLEEEFAVDEYGWAQYKLAGAKLCLYLTGGGGGDGKPGNELNFHLATKDAAALCAALKTRGVKIISDLVTSDDGGKVFIIADPDHNTFKIVQQA